MGRRRAVSSTSTPPPARRRGAAGGGTGGGEEGDRHRQLLRRLDEVQADHRVAAVDLPGRRSAPDDCLLSRPLARIRAGGAAAGAAVTKPRIPFLSLVPGEDA